MTTGFIKEKCNACGKNQWVLVMDDDWKDDHPCCGHCGSGNKADILEDALRMVAVRWTPALDGYCWCSRKGEPSEHKPYCLIAKNALTTARDRRRTMDVKNAKRIVAAWDAWMNADPMEQGPAPCVGETAIEAGAFLDAKDAKIDEAERRGAEKFRDGVVGVLNDYPDITVDDLAWIKNRVYALLLEGPKDGRP